MIGTNTPQMARKKTTTLAMWRREEAPTYELFIMKKLSDVKNARTVLGCTKNARGSNVVCEDCTRLGSKRYETIRSHRLAVGVFNHR